MSEGNDRRNDGHALRVARHGDDERAVDLERGDRKFREIRKRRITRAEVVDGDLQAHLADRREFLYVFFYVPHDDAFGDFKIELTAFASRFLDGAVHGLDKVPLLQLNRRHVDCDARRTPVLHAPTAGVLQCFAYRPLAHLQDHPGFLEYGNELYGRDQSRFRVLPPDQGLEPGDTAALSIHFRLIVQDELIQFDRLAKLVLEQQGFCDPRIHFRPIEQIPFPRFLGLLQRRLGVSEQGVGVFSICREHRNAGGGCNPDLLPLDSKRCLEERCNRLVDRISDVAGITDIRKSAGKDICRDPRHTIRLRPDCFDALCEFAQQRIPGLPPESVVDQAEAIDVAGCDDDLGTAVLGRVQQLCQPFVKQRPIGKARKRVVIREIGEPLLLADVLERKGDIAREVNQQLHFFAVEEPELAGVQGKNADRLTADDQRQSGQRIDPALQAFLLHHSLRIALNVVRDHGHFFSDCLPDQAPSSGLRHGKRRIFQETTYLAVPGDRLYSHGFAVDDARPGHAELSGSHSDAAGIAKQLIPAVHAHDSGVDSAQHRVDTAELYELLFTLAPLGDVPGNSIYPDYIACRVAGEASASLDPPHFAVRLHDPVFRFERLAYRGVLPEGHHPRPVFGVDQLAPKRAALVNLLLRPAENRGRGGADIQDLTRRNRSGPYDVWQRGDDAPQPIAKRLEFFFRLAAGRSLFPLSQRPLHGGRQTHEIRLHHIVGGAAPQRADGKFLADRSRNEDERRVRAYLARQAERSHAGEARH